MNGLELLFHIVEFLGSPVTSYADSMVRELLYSHSYDQQTVAPDAMVILNIWMQVVQKVSSCPDIILFL